MDNLVRMTRETPAVPGDPVVADVQSEDVAQWIDNGWAAESVEDAVAPPAGSLLERMTLAELRDHAKAYGIPIPADITAKADILDHILASS